MEPIFAQEFVNIFTGVDLNEKRLPLMSVDSGVPGPTIWLCAAIHGDEVTGTAVIHSLFRKIKREGLLKGKIFAFPILNTFGFEFISRHEPYADADLNRVFPGDKNGLIPERLANAIAETILRTNPDFVIDLHTDSDNSIAYGMIDFFGDKQNEMTKKIIDLANVLKLPYALSTSETEGYDISKSLSGYLVFRKITAMTLELGGPLFVNRKFEAIGLDAICNLLSKLEMIKPEIKTYEFFNLMENKIYKFTDKITTSYSGIMKFKVRPGEKILKGQILGSVRDVFGKKIETIIAKKDGILFSHDDQAITFPGQGLFTIVTEV
jgi:uncharacterized protein